MAECHSTLTVDHSEAARLIGVTEKTLRTWREKKGIPHFRVGRRVLYPRAGLQEWVNRFAAETIAV